MNLEEEMQLILNSNSKNTKSQKSPQKDPRLKALNNEILDSNSNIKKNSKKKAIYNNNFIQSDLNVDFDAEIYIKTWIDLAKDVGIAYVLINGVIGINFKDDMKILFILESDDLLVVKPLGTKIITYVTNFYEIDKKEPSYDHLSSDITSKIPTILSIKNDLRKKWFT